MQSKTLSLTPFIRGAERAGAKRTLAYEWISAGLIPPPIHVGVRAYLAAHEVDAVVAARLAGKSDDEIKAVVRLLVEQRKGAVAEVSS